LTLFLETKRRVSTKFQESRVSTAVRDLAHHAWEPTRRLTNNLLTFHPTAKRQAIHCTTSGERGLRLAATTWQRHLEYCGRRIVTPIALPPVFAKAAASRSTSSSISSGADPAANHQPDHHDRQTRPCPGRVGRHCLCRLLLTPLTRFLPSPAHALPINLLFPAHSSSINSLSATHEPAASCNL
jgi:hypothetical protein